MAQENFKVNMSQMCLLFNVKVNSTSLLSNFHHLSPTLFSSSKHQKRFDYAVTTNSIPGASKKLLFCLFSTCPLEMDAHFGSVTALPYITVTRVPASQRRIHLEDLQSYNRGRTTTTTTK